MGVMTNRWVALPHPTQAGQVGGHEGIGKIVKMGPGTEMSARKVGDRVGIKWISAACGSCAACLNGNVSTPLLYKAMKETNDFADSLRTESASTKRSADTTLQELSNNT